MQAVSLRFLVWSGTIYGAPSRAAPPLAAAAEEPSHLNLASILEELEQLLLQINEYLHFVFTIAQIDIQGVS